MAYTTPQIDTILLKADKVMYKIGQKAYDSMFAEDNEALDYERDIIFIYKKAVEYGENVLIGTDKFDKVVERLATKIAGYDYGELNPIYSDVNSLSIPILFPGSALNDLTDVTIANLLDNQLLRYNAATGQWVNVGPGAAVRNSQAFIASAGQTVFTTSIPFDAGLFDLYVNGVKLNSLSFTTMGEYQITLNDPCSAGDIVDVVVYDPNTGINPSANTLNDLTDVSIGPLANKQGLYYNSATGLWENGLVFVPYTGATAAVDLGEFEIRAGQFTLDTSPTGTATVGTTRWNDNIGSSETTLKGGSVILKNGVDLVARVVNKVTPNTTLTKASYAAVRISGAQGQRLAVAYAQANNDANSADTIGLVTETIPTNQEGFIMTMGSLEGINTTGSLQGETWADGDVLYLSPTVPGGITNVKPTGATGHIVVVGYVEYAHANNGKIFVKTMNGWELDELHNVSINYATLANGNVLKYNSTTQLWENGIDAGGITGSGAAGQVPYFTGATSLGGSDNLFWDNANGRLGIGTNTPAVKLQVVGTSQTAIFGGTGSDNYITIKDSSGNLFIGRSTAYSYIWSTPNLPLDFWTNNAPRLRIFGGGNVLLQSGGTFTDSGQRLQVIGDTLLRGSTADTTANALAVQNSSSTALFTVRNDGLVSMGTASITTATITSGTVTSLYSTSIRSATTSATFTGAYQGILNGSDITATVSSGNLTGLISGQFINASSGGGAFLTHYFGSGVSSAVRAAAEVGTFKVGMNSTLATLSISGGYGAGTAGSVGIGTVGTNYQTNALNVKGSPSHADLVGDVISNTSNNVTTILIRRSDGLANGTLTSRIVIGTLIQANSVFSYVTGYNTGASTLTVSTPLGNGTLLPITVFEPIQSWTKQDNTFGANINYYGNFVIGDNGVNDTTALVQMNSTTKGFLPPRMTETQRNAIASPASGLTIYNSTTNQMNIFNGASWGPVGGGLSPSENLFNYYNFV